MPEPQQEPPILADANTCPIPPITQLFEMYQMSQVSDISQISKLSNTSSNSNVKTGNTINGSIKSSELCINLDKLCNFWWSKGACDDNSGYMHRYCAKACQTCHLQTKEFLKWATIGECQAF